MPKIQAPTVAEHRAMRRRAVVDNAVSLLVESGPAALTPAAVAKMTGLARTSVYQYFPTGGDLLGAAFEELLRGCRRDLDEALAQAGDDIDARIDAYVRTTLIAARRGHRPTLLAGVEPPPSCRERLRELHREIARPLRDIVVDTGVEDVDTVTALVEGTVHGAVTLLERGVPLEEVVGRTVVFLRRALAV
ncbi:transcriptional regulator, TetR family [Austwickia chelonae]|uniref:Putative TetR family transcriptional regulator n=1 Tax=Austwickia chelonae NBRC 105200 TaxID=1184607 RepID=K6UNY5_9MICO|nr:TetR/AcrR family transcriptional regulator [Austwickia chelonae]GAB79356.1 putative TetR family transcriptional regulator [Austwickia chelonae NBRC 105200]SEW43943.1 transcriptional regulator, TetR family [Austwickia chelonae]